MKTSAKIHQKISMFITKITDFPLKHNGNYRKIPGINGILTKKTNGRSVELQYMIFGRPDTIRNEKKS